MFEIYGGPRAAVFVNNQQEPLTFFGYFGKSISVELEVLCRASAKN
jgi:hypothetical protein